MPQADRRPAAVARRFGAFVAERFPFALERALAALAALGMPLIDATPRIGAHGKRIAFVHPKALGGVLLELSEDPRTGCGTHPRGPHAGSTGARG